MPFGNIIDRLIYVLGMDTGEFEGKAAAAESRVGTMVSGFSRLTSIVGGLAAAFGAWKLVDFIRDATLTAARTEVLATVSHQVGESAGYSSAYIDDLTEKIKAMGITTQVSRQAIVRFIQSELDLTEAAKLARVAQDLAVISGQNSSEALETIVEAIAAQRPILLKQFGIVKDLTEVYNTQAKALGKNADQLTELEKKQAFVNVIMEAGTKVSGSYEAAMGDVGKQLTSLPRYFEELQNVIGEKFLPIFGEFVETLTKALRNMRRALGDDLALLREDLVKFSNQTKSAADNVPALINRFRELAENTNRTLLETDELYKVQSRIDALAPGLIKDVNEQGIAYGLTAEALAEYLKKRQEEEEALRAILGVGYATRIAELRAELKELNQLKAEYLAAPKEKSWWEQLTTFSVTGPGFKTISRDALPTLESVNRKIQEVNAQIAHLGLESEVATNMFVDGLIPVIEKITELDKAIEGLVTPDVFLEPVQFYSVQKIIDNLRWQLSQGLIDETTYRRELLKLKRGLEDTGAGMTSEWDKVNTELEKSFADAVDEIITGPLEDFGRIAAEGIGMTPLEENAEKTKKLWNKTTAAIADNIVMIMAQLDSQIARIMNNIAAAIGSFAAGGPAGIIGGIAAGFGALAGIADLFRGSSDKFSAATDQLIDSNERLIAAEASLESVIEHWISEAFELSEREREYQRAAVERMLARAGPGLTQEQVDAMVDRLEALGITVPDWAQLPSTFRYFLEQWIASQEEYNRILTEGLKDLTQEQRIALLQQLGPSLFDPTVLTMFLTPEEARSLIEFWVKQFNLTAEEQLELWEAYLQALIDTGEASAESIMRIMGIIHDLREDIARQQEADTGKEQTQISRSIQRITEKQADSLMAILQTIEYRLREYLTRIIDQLNQIIAGAVAGGAGAGGITLNITGNWNFNSASGEDAARQVMRTLNDQVRAAGGQVVFS